MSAPVLVQDDQKDESDRERALFYWDWNKHEDEIFTSRGSFFLVGQSMLIAAAATLMAADLERLRAALLLLASTGLLLAVVQLLVCARHTRTQRMIREQLRVHHPLWTLVYDSRPGFPRAASLMGAAVPAVVLVCWIGLVASVAIDWIGR